jgi:alpha-1,6-mannosyltransferase
MPIINLAAAAGFERLHRLAFIPHKDKSPSKVALVLWLGGVLSCFVSLLASFAFVGVSRHNYPGGTALQLLLLQRGKDQSANVTVHIDVAAAMTGVSLFGQRDAGPHWTFVKAGYEAENEAGGDFSDFTYLLSENRDVEGFHVLATAPGSPRLNWRRGRIETRDGIYVLERDK